MTRNIKKLDLVTSLIDRFTFYDFKFITDFRYWIEIDTVNLFDEHNIPMLRIDFILIRTGAPTYKVTLQFTNVGNLQLASGGAAVQLSLFQILDISDRGWDSYRFHVGDFEEEGRFKFYCNEVEVIAIEEIDLYLV
ncbi:hypothetical protein NSS64_02835 [Paenibacillus sp. FSL H8-0122]|uniref:hypothetical protein n=1 Tax=unclassified Paenibacillus TaxID=185978 RepID=UPI0030FB044C